MPDMMMARLRRMGATLRDDCSGLAFMEFALMLPILLAVGGYGIELSNLALANMRVSQWALTLADNASRVGVDGTNGTTTLREVDINDVFQATRLDSDKMQLSTYGRVTLSSLENLKGSGPGASYKQMIHWQRCFGKKSGTGFASSYGDTTATAGSDQTTGNAGTAAPTGMGDTGAKVLAPQDSGVMFVEINYLYQPLFGTLFVGASKLHYVASYIVRDRRDFRQLYNPDPAAVASTCDKFTA